MNGGIGGAGCCVTALISVTSRRSLDMIARSTQIYTHMGIENLKEAVRRAHLHCRRPAAVKL